MRSAIRSAGIVRVAFPPLPYPSNSLWPASWLPFLSFPRPLVSFPLLPFSFPLPLFSLLLFLVARGAEERSPYSDSVIVIASTISSRSLGFAHSHRLAIAFDCLLFSSFTFPASCFLLPSPFFFPSFFRLVPCRSNPNRLDLLLLASVNLLFSSPLLSSPLRIVSSVRVL